MAPFNAHTIALFALAAFALGPTSPTGALPEAVRRFAAPTAQEETIYRPECPMDEVSGGWLSCRVAGAHGG